MDLHCLPSIELQIRKGTEDNSQIIFFYFSMKTYVCVPSLEPSRRDGSNDGSQNMFLWRNMAFDLPESESGFEIMILIHRFI